MIKNESASMPKVFIFTASTGAGHNLAARSMAEVLGEAGMDAVIYDANPNENAEAKLVQTVPVIDSEIMSSAGSSDSVFGTGGMITKIGAAKYATERGIDTIIASGEDVRIIYDILEGKEIGTHFLRKEVQEVQNV